MLTYHFNIPAFKNHVFTKSAKSPKISTSAISEITADDETPFGLVIGNDTFSATDTNGMSLFTFNNGDGRVQQRGGGDLILDGDNILFTSTSSTNALTIEATTGNLLLTSDRMLENSQKGKRGDIHI